MREHMSYTEAREMLLDLTTATEPEHVPLADCAGRILARDLAAAENVPPFDRSPYDGYAFRAADTAAASRETPVTLEILEEVPAGAVPTKTVVPGTAVKILTGAPIPEGADAVIMYELTEFTESQVRLFAPVKSGENIIRAGEDVKKGQILAQAGMAIDAGLAGTLAAQGISRPLVHRRPRVGILSTGNEITELDMPLEDGKIYNSNRYTLAAALLRAGCEARYLGLAGDSVEAIAVLIRAGLESCDALLLTGGVSVGDYDLTPQAMELSGVDLLALGVDIKPGMACAYGVKDGKLVCGLSGNPASSLTNFYAVVLPAINRLCGRREAIPREITVSLAESFRKKSPLPRFLRGRLDLSEGTARMHLPGDQGNVVISSSIGCDVMALVPAGSGPLEAGTKLKGFLL